jgi:hypothetical protein
MQTHCCGLNLREEEILENLQAPNRGQHATYAICLVERAAFPLRSGITTARTGEKHSRPIVKTLPTAASATPTATASTVATAISAAASAVAAAPSGVLGFGARFVYV